MNLKLLLFSVKQFILSYSFYLLILVSFLFKLLTLTTCANLPADFSEASDCKDLLVSLSASRAFLRLLWSETAPCGFSKMIVRCSGQLPRNWVYIIICNK